MSWVKTWYSHYIEYNILAQRCFVRELFAAEQSDDKPKPTRLCVVNSNNKIIKGWTLKVGKWLLSSEVLFWPVQPRGKSKACCLCRRRPRDGSSTGALKSQIRGRAVPQIRRGAGERFRRELRSRSVRSRLNKPSRALYNKIPATKHKRYNRMLFPRFCMVTL